MSNSGIIVMTTADSTELAESLCKVLIENKLAACIQELPIKSHYKWDGNLACDPEILLLIKTTEEASGKAIELIKEHHTYDLPEIITVPITGGLPGYLNWLHSETT